VRWLRCVDETNPEWPGGDEIGIGGVAINTDGTSTKVAAKTYNDFDDGNTEWFNPPWKFAEFTRPAPASGQWGYDSFGVIVALAEKDGSGFSDFLTELWDKVKVEVLAIVTTVVTAGTAPVLGIGAPIAGIVAAWAVNELVEWFLGWFDDDIFTPKKATMTVPRSGVTFWEPGTTYEGLSVRTPQRSLDFYGFGGHYQVRYDWRFTNWVAGSGSQQHRRRRKPVERTR